MRNNLQDSPPYPVEAVIKKLGNSLRTARIRRQMTIEEVAERIGTGVRAVADAESGKMTSGIVTYAALLWVYDLINQLEDVADPFKDRYGLGLMMAKEPQRVRKGKGLDNDF